MSLLFRKIFSSLILLSALTLAACQTTTQRNRPTSDGSAPISVEKLPPRTLHQQQTMSGITQQDKMRVAILLPLTGTNAQLGQDLLASAQMSLFDHGSNQLELMIHDTQGTPAQASAAAQQALHEGAQLIVGPLFSQEVAAVKAIASQANVPVLSFSNNQKVADSQVFILGFDPSEQVREIISVAAAHNIRNIGALLPENAYGDLLQDALVQAVAHNDIRIEAIAFYRPGTSDFSAQAIKLRNIPLQGLFVPEGGDTLKLVISSLQYNDVDLTQVRLLGSGQWDTPQTFTTSSARGGWFVAPAPYKRAQFEQKFRTQFGHSPPRIATLSYDAMSLAAILSQTRQGNSLMLSELTQPRGFDGIDGTFRLIPNGLVERRLAVLEVANHGVKVVSPAKAEF
ncbi:MAG: penicillin-binding protein activator [Pseudomonadota bacterium]